MVENIVNNNHIIFLIEHWLGNAESSYLSDISSNHSIIFSSDFNNSEKLAGRPFGGRCWFIHNSIRVLHYEELGLNISKITIEGDDLEKSTIYGIWQPYDDGGNERLACLYNNLAMLKADFINSSDQDIYIVGDFNCDLNRGKRFDSIFSKFLQKNFLFDAAKKSNSEGCFTYSKGDYVASLDHIVVNFSALEKVNSFEVMYDSLCLSDHKAVRCSVKPIVKFSIFNQVPMRSSSSKHKFPVKFTLMK